MKSVVWLKLDSDQISLQETWEYKMRRSMISASVFLCLKSEGGTVSGSAEGSIKIPIKGRYGFEASGDLMPGRSPVEFNTINVRPSLDLPRTQTWEAKEEALCYQDSGSSEVSRYSVNGFSFGRVMSPLAVIPSLAHSWVGGNIEYRGILVAGRRPTAIRIHAQSPTTKSVFPIQIRAINFLNLGPSFSEREWSELAWEKAFSLEGQFDEEKRELISLSATVPIIGQIRLDLSRHEVIRSERSR